MQCTYRRHDRIHVLPMALSHHQPPGKQLAN
jgi:hypothetical protein